MKKKKIQWHPAFVAAMRLEFAGDREQLDFKSEYNLNTKPLTMDLLIIRKQKNAKLHNEIGAFFRGHNIMEYKSPDDSMGVDVLYKALGYACLYKSYGDGENSIRADDVTVSLVREGTPEVLFSYFRENGIVCKKHGNGIYYVEDGLLFPVQVIVSKELGEEEHVWLKSLSKKLDTGRMSKLVHKSVGLKQKSDREFADSVLQVSMQANPEIAKLLKEGGDMCEALLELMKPEIQEIARQGEERGRSEGISIGEARGISIGEARGEVKGIIRIMLKQKHSYGDILEELVEQMNLTKEQAEEYLNSYLEKNGISL